VLEPHACGPFSQVSTAAAAEVMGVSKRSVEDARALKRTAPELHEKVKRGEMKAGEARKLATAIDRMRYFANPGMQG
jgi:hypothetical protein